MNVKDNPTVEQLRELIASCDDAAGHHIQWVDKDGEAYVDLVTPGLTPAGWASANESRIQFRLETCLRGNGYVGRKAAGDAAYVKRIFRAFVDNWAKGTKGYVDIF